MVMVPSARMASMEFAIRFSSTRCSASASALTMTDSRHCTNWMVEAWLPTRAAEVDTVAVRGRRQLAEQVLHPGDDLRYGPDRIALELGVVEVLERIAAQQRERRHAVLDVVDHERRQSMERFE